MQCLFRVYCNIDLFRVILNGEEYFQHLNGDGFGGRRMVLFSVRREKYLRIFELCCVKRKGIIRDSCNVEVEPV